MFSSNWLILNSISSTRQNLDALVDLSSGLSCSSTGARPKGTAARGCREINPSLFRSGPSPNSRAATPKDVSPALMRWYSSVARVYFCSYNSTTCSVELVFDCRYKESRRCPTADDSSELTPVLPAAWLEVSFDQRLDYPEERC